MQNKPPLAKKIAFITLGCKVNQYESQGFREDFQKQGYEETSPDRADVCILNTCTVTGRSDQKTRKIIRGIKRQRPESILVITGCYAQRARDELERMEEVDLVVGNDSKFSLAEQVVHFLSGNFEFHANAQGRSIDRTIENFYDRTRAFVKIQEGCDSFCSYCIIPYVRGAVRSKSPEKAVEEIENLTKNGVKEVVLTGIHLGKYGKETGYRWNLFDLLERLIRMPGLFRIRLSSLEINEVDERLLDLMASSPRFVPHLHLPLQAGNDETLKTMNRHYTTGQFEEVCRLVRQKLDTPAITTDIIVGFPGETEVQFEHGVEFCRRMEFSRTHIFPYADREGTAAFGMLPKIDERTKKERVQKLMALAARSRLKYHQLFEGKIVHALVERQEEEEELPATPHGIPDCLCGMSERYVRVYFPGQKELINCLLPVRVTQATEDYLIGVPE